MKDCWKISLPVAKADADRIVQSENALRAFEPVPVVVVTEISPERPNDYRLDVFVEDEPSATLVAAVRTLAGVHAGENPLVERLPDADWVTMSQAGLDPVHAGRFTVHVAADRDQVPKENIGLQIEASRAFGTGHHATTAGCLRALSNVKEPPQNILDLGTGTGLLAIAATKLFPAARVAASDIDPVSIEVGRENLDVNAVREGDDAGSVKLVVADGLDDENLARRAPYDLIFANILAGPLIDMSGSIAGVLAPGGSLILAGLLTDQAGDVLAAYEKAGLTPTDHDPNRGWPILVMTRIS